MLLHIQVKLLDTAMPAPPRRRPALRPARQHAYDDSAVVATEPGTAAGGQRTDSGDSGGGGDGSGAGAERSGSGGSSGGSSDGGEGQHGSGKQEGDWAAGPGAQRIAPAVEALTMLARNNTKNRCAYCLRRFFALSQSGVCTTGETQRDHTVAVNTGLWAAVLLIAYCKLGKVCMAAHTAHADGFSACAGRRPFRRARCRRCAASCRRGRPALCRSRWMTC